MLSLETVSIEPAYQALGMNPTEYPAYVASLPFGAKYLLERSAVTQLPAAQPQPAQPAKEPQRPRRGQPAIAEVQPQLDEQQQAFLDFIIANPDTPSSSLSKGLQVSVWKVNQLRDSLKAQGLIEQLETRLGRAGRRTLFYIPTFQGLELMGKEPPPGRGGAIHRHIQHLIEEGAIANGFSAQCEYDLDNGGIVDVHLEKGDYRIAVEIAITSRPQRELAHIQNALAVNYDRVFDIFADQRTLERTQEAVADGVSEAERAKVQLLHLSKLSDLIYSIASVDGGRVVVPTELKQGE